jgi:histone deacetylase 1/2
LPCPDAEITNPAAASEGGASPGYSVWHQQDQAILSAILSSLTEGVIGLVMLAATSQEAWETLEVSFASQSTARVMQLHSALSKVKKLNSTATAFFNKVKALADTLSSIGQSLRPEEFNSYLLAGLDSDYDALADRVSSRPLDDPMPIRNVFSQLLNAEQRIESRKADIGSDMHMAHYTSRPTGGSQAQYRPDSRQGIPAQNQFSTAPQQRRDQAQGRPSGSTGGSRTCPTCGAGGGRPTCQICSKVGHVASCCFKRFQKNFLGTGNDGRNMDRQIAVFSATHSGSTSSYPVDPSWYADTAAMDHLTNNLDKLTMREQYRGKDHVQTANGKGMRITHIGQSIIPTLSHSLHLKNILHVPSVTRNLLSVKKLTSDNNVFFKFHPLYFLIKDRESREVLLRGGCRGGFYNLDDSTIKQVFSSVKVSRDQWHSRLGHPATPIVQHILHRHELPSVSVNKVVVCDICQQGKSHQLPFSLSTRETSAPHDIIYSDVWDPAQTSVSGHQFYVSFVDAYSRFTWLYLLKHKSGVFQIFLQFQQHVERLLNKKIIHVQSDWGGKYH